MAAKKITLTDEHIRLIQNINFHAFEFGEELPIQPIMDAMEEIESMPPERQKKYSRLHSKLFDIKNRINEYNDEAAQNGWGVNQWNMFGGTYVMEDASSGWSVAWGVNGTYERSLNPYFDLVLEGSITALRDYIDHTFTALLRLRF